MSIFPDAKTFIKFGNFSIAWYAIIIITGAIIALQLTKKAAEKRGISKDLVENMFYGVLPAGLIGSRLWYVLFYPDKSYFLNNPVKIFAFRDGGLAIQGGLLAGAAYAYYICKKEKIDFVDLADSTLPNVLIAQAIGRWGNFLNQEAFGQVVSESFYAKWPLWFKNQMFINGAYRQPTFLLESSLNILGFFLIYFGLEKIKNIKKGDYAFAYLFWYGIVRFIVEHFRSDSLMFLNFKSAQIVSLIFVIIGTLGFSGYFVKNKNSDVLVLFDFDGTIANSNPLIIKSFNEVFNKHFPDLKISREMEVSYVGPSLHHTFRKYLNIEDVDQYVEEYRQINFKQQKEELTEIKNASKLIKFLKRNKVVVGIVSSKWKDSLDLGLNILKLNEYMDVVIGGDQVEVDKPNPQGILKAKEIALPKAKHCFYVGDTVSDILAAKAAGFKSIALLGVKEIRQEIIDSQPDYLVEDLLEIIEIIEEVI